MDFETSEEQLLLADSLTRFLGREYGFEARNRFLLTDSGFSEAAWTSYAELGLLALALPQQYGGFGGGAVDLMPVLHAMGSALALEPFIATLVSARLIERLGSESQQAEHLPAVAEGALKLAMAHGEQGRRYRRAHVTVQASPHKGGWLLTGEKVGVDHGDAADLLLVSARTSGLDDEEDGISVFLVDPSSPGARRRTYRNMDGHGACDLRLEGVFVPAGSRLSGQGAAYPAIDEALDFASALVCAEAVGTISWANAQTLEYLKTRKQYGRAIGSFQVLQHRMVELMITEEQASSMACLACVAMDSESDPSLRARSVSAARIRLIQACRQVSQDTVQMHGGMGMTEEMMLSHCFRRMLVMSQAYGDLDFHLSRVAEIENTHDQFRSRNFEAVSF